MKRYQILLCGCGVAARLIAQQPDIGPAPGKLVDIGGRRLHLLCSGAGAPTVVLEAGASAFAIDWTFVQQQVSRTTRVCSYDRAGSGWSDPPASGPPTSERDLHELLRVAGEKGPFVMVGASRGGLLVRSYQSDYPSEVIGLVLVDPSSEDRLFTYFNGEAVTIASLTAEQWRTTFPQQPVVVPKRRPQVGAPFNKLPPETFALRVKLDERLIASVPDTVSPQFIATYQEADRALLAKLLRLKTGREHPLGDLPLVVLTRGIDSPADLRSTHAALAQLSTNSRHIVVAGSDHEIHLFEPAVVSQAITDVEAVAVRNTRLPR
jgi:pimeloyl-ACP methyl ester carboxylesterase